MVMVSDGDGDAGGESGGEAKRTCFFCAHWYSAAIGLSCKPRGNDHAATVTSAASAKFTPRAVACAIVSSATASFSAASTSSSSAGSAPAAVAGGRAGAVAGIAVRSSATVAGIADFRRVVCLRAIDW